MIFGAWLQVTVSPFVFIISRRSAFVKTRSRNAFHTAGQALREEPLRALRAQLPFQGSHFYCKLYHRSQISNASPERARGTAKRWRGAPPAPTSPHSTTYPHTAKPPGTNPWGPCVQLIILPESDSEKITS